MPRLPTGKGPRLPTSETTSAGGKHQHHTARLHLHARSTSCTSQDRETSYLHDTYGHRVYIRTWIGSAYIDERLYASSSSTNYIVGSSSIYKSVLHCQSDHETTLMQLVSTVDTDLKLPTRVSPPYSHESQGKVERFHRNLFGQLRTTRLQWSKDLNIEPHMLPPESLRWALHHSIFILSNYLVHSSGKTSHFKNYRYNYRSNIVRFGEIVLDDIRNMPTQKLRLRNQHRKLRGIWLGRDLITNEHILALPLQYSRHRSTTTGAYIRSRGNDPIPNDPHFSKATHFETNGCFETNA